MLLTRLPQELFYQKRLRLSDFIGTSDVYDLLYTAFSYAEKNNTYHFKFETLDVFNNVAVLCTMVLHDDDIPAAHYRSYWDYIKCKSDTTYQARLTMWLTYGILSLVQPTSGKTDRFLQKIDNKYNLQDQGDIYKNAVLDFIKTAQERKLQMTIYDFPLRMLSTKENPTCWNSINWKEITNDSQTEDIDKVIDIFGDYTDKVRILDMIRKAFILEEEERKREEQENPYNLPF